jgi:uncharacterized membrane protein YidH (DUF202 family)
MGGIVSDIQALIQQQVRLMRAEVAQDLHKFRRAVALLAPGVGVLVSSAFVLALMLAHLIHWLTTPAGMDDHASMPLWVCYLIVGVVLAIVGGVLVFLGKKQVDSVNPLSGPTAQTLEENIQWMSNPK